MFKGHEFTNEKTVMASNKERFQLSRYDKETGTNKQTKNIFDLDIEMLE